jgi:hypothetical protein
VFFGREKLTTEILDRLAASLSRAGQARFIAIVGNSGIGKSSVARAGVLAALRDGRIPGSENWPQIICRPEANPVRNLAMALEAGFSQARTLGAVDDTITRLLAKEEALDLAVRVSLGAGAAGRRAVLLIDQFEECFTLCTDAKIREAFFRNLINAATVPDGSTVVLITLRFDELRHCLDHPGLGPQVDRAHVLVLPMDDDELRAAIEGPARTVHV